MHYLYLKDIGGGQRAIADVFYDDEGRDDGYEWSTTAVAGYIKVTSIATFLAIGAMNFSKCDFVGRKDAMKQLVIDAGSGDEDAGVDTLATQADKEFVCAHLIGSYTKRLTVFGGDFAAMEAATTPYHLNAIPCRRKRFNTVVPNGHTYIPMYMGVILSEIGMLDRYYVEQGLKGQPYDPLAYGTGLSNYINGIAPFDGIAIVPYLGTTCLGLALKGWTTVDGRPITDLVADWNKMLFEQGV